MTLNELEFQETLKMGERQFLIAEKLKFSLGHVVKQTSIDIKINVVFMS